MINGRKRSVLGALSLSAHALSMMLSYGWVVLLVALLASPIGLHVRVSYTYYGPISDKSFTSCAYLGSRGIVHPDLAPDCPLIAVLDARAWGR